MSKKLIEETISNPNEVVQSSLTVNTNAIYPVKELASAAGKIFGANVRSECVFAAFRAADKESAALPEAKEIVKSFLRKEIQ